jgi:hypothetical protein
MFFVIQLCNVNKQNALFKLLFCLLHVSNILCSSSGRLYCTCSLIWYDIHAFKQAACHVKGCALFFPLFGVYAITRLVVLLYHLRLPTYLGQGHSRNYLGCKRSKNYTNICICTYTLPLHYTIPVQRNRFLT